MDILNYFKHGTQDTQTGRRVGLEVETDFLNTRTGQPITLETRDAIMAAAATPPPGVVVQQELGRQKIEIALSPDTDPARLLVRARTALEWLYGIARQYGARPHFGPEVDSDEPLLAATEARDRLWLQIDGAAALEELCRCSSVQFTVDVNPLDAARVLNELWSARLHELDYAPNQRHWQRYLDLSRGGYHPLRFGGPAGFNSLEDYASQLRRQPVLMHGGQVVRLNPETTPGLDMDLYLRSVWWHYRLRRYGDTLAVEIRPFARRGDGAIAEYWSNIAPIFNRQLSNLNR